MNGQDDAVRKLHTVAPPTQLCSDVFSFGHAILGEKIEQVLRNKLNDVKRFVDEIAARNVQQFVGA